MSNNIKTYFAYFCLFVISITGFIPHPSVRLGGQAGESITHTEITQQAFIRSLARYFLDTHAIRTQEINHSQEFTIDELYHLAYPHWTTKQVRQRSYPLKSILDAILAENGLVDFDAWTKKLPAAHFDSEAFSNGSRRILELRRQIINDTRTKAKILTEARKCLGQLLHTLQDFYSHSNWVELGKAGINDRLGIHENIGPVAASNQSTCTSSGCTKIRVRCSLYQKITLNKCPLEYYECKNNIRPEIITQGLLTSGYSSNQHNENNDSITKPTNVEKCSHGSVMDITSHQPAVGGINKDTTIPLYSPRFDLHYEAANLAVIATEQFLNDLRRDLGNNDFDRLFAIHPTVEELHAASKAIAHMRKWQFFSSSVSSGLSLTARLMKNFRKSVKERLKKIKWKLFGNSNDILKEDFAFRRRRKRDLILRRRRQQLH
ncbi:unnamed protein product [Rotaria magnacalcarata]|uniref:VWA7 N-terminal domain-containing protein n=1 Tax=Rotaria magnacalcarata TaxID=392030 RepID=A0A8S2ZUF2_9BILA|nr:unnamed protein product [Rotaria magnacalcarata]